MTQVNLTLAVFTISHQWRFYLNSWFESTYNQEAHIPNKAQKQVHQAIVFDKDEQKGQATLIEGFTSYLKKMHDINNGPFAFILCNHVTVHRISQNLKTFTSTYNEIISCMLYENPHVNKEYSKSQLNK